MLKFEIVHKYRYCIVRGTVNGRKGWVIGRKKVTPLLHIRYGKPEVINHLFTSLEAAQKVLAQAQGGEL